MNIFKFANSVDPDEVAHNEPPHLDLHTVCPLLFESPYDIGWMKYFQNFADINFAACFFRALKINQCINNI